MSPSIRLGRLFGIDIAVNWSLIFVIAWIAWNIESQLPSNVPHHSLAAYWTTAIAAAILFYACLLAHELSHALVARGRGVKVQGITLWLLGGVARLEGEPASAKDEALIAGVGPLSSLVISALFFALANLPTSDLVDIVFSYLFFANLALAVFNLVPAFPLDGGRMLSAALWWRGGTRQQGVHNAVRVGRVFAYLMVASGVPLVILGQGLQGIWLAFIGWFLLSAGSQEEAGSTVRILLRSIPVSTAMSSPVVTLPDWVTVEQFLESVAPNHSFTTYPIHDPSGKLTGVVRLRDLVRVPAGDRGRKHLIDVAVPISGVPTTNPREELLPLMERLGRGLDQRVLVFDDGRLVGILSPADVARVASARQAASAGPPAA